MNLEQFIMKWSATASVEMLNDMAMVWQAEGKDPEIHLTEREQAYEAMIRG